MSRTRAVGTLAALAAVTVVMVALGLTLFPLTGVAAASPLALTAGAAQKETPANLQKARLIYKEDPEYPDSARAKKIEGDDEIEILIDQNGAVKEAKVVRPLDPDLDAAAVEAVKHWRFEPARLDGKPVATHMTLTIRFRLD